jgi:uncharacterized C2H2 Zn-finger protein
MTLKTRTKVPHGSPLFPDRPRFSSEEITKRQSEQEIFAQRCREIFHRVYPELVNKYHDWFIYIEPNSGEYFIDSERILAREKAKEKYPTAVLMAMCLNETGTVGKI